MRHISPNHTDLAARVYRTDSALAAAFGEKYADFPIGVLEKLSDYYTGARKTQSVPIAGHTQAMSIAGYAERISVA